ncbi:NADH-quinone oxidoreductase subunit C [Solicola sp. PLA-1-18]|uniref:NADH-quinone oxidoreductase subunit C n=1 Tax=Solicola sp. PLA-1-18 TaxID=3380532 RepID=UPI003B7780B9
MTAPTEALDVARAAAGDLADGLRVEDGFGPPTLHVPAAVWRTVLLALRDRVGLSYFDWLSAVDELDAGFTVVCHVARLGDQGGLRHLLVATTVPRESPSLDSLVPVWEGAAWHERETHEMFGIGFDGGVALTTLLLPERFEGHPLRKDFVLASRVAKAWPGAKEPGESDADVASAGSSPGRRRQRPPGVPEPEVWGPREPGSDAPDPLAPARAPVAAQRPRRGRTAAASTDAPPGTPAPRARRSRRQADVAPPPAEGDDGA